MYSFFPPGTRCLCVDSRSLEAVECFGHGGIGPGHGLDDIEEIACVNEDVGFLADDLICHF